jgi:hypothetical protein
MFCVGSICTLYYLSCEEKLVDADPFNTSFIHRLVYIYKTGMINFSSVNYLTPQRSSTPSFNIKVSPCYSSSG